MNIEVKITPEIVRCDYITNNGRIYTKEVMQKAIEKYIEKHGNKLKYQSKYFEE